MYYSGDLWMKKEVLSSSLLPPRHVLQSWSTWHLNAIGSPRSAPQTPKSPLSSAPGPAQPFLAFQMLSLDPAPAPQRRIAGSTLHLTACVCDKAKSLRAQTPPLPRAAQLQTAHVSREGCKIGGKAWAPRQTHVQPSWRMESLWLWGFGPSPILGVALKAKQCSLK